MREVVSDPELISEVKRAAQAASLHGNEPQLTLQVYRQVRVPLTAATFRPVLDVPGLRVPVACCTHCTSTLTDEP
jgi:hypothetical protein